MNSELRGKVALVTGGTDGIGKEIARGLARSGYGVLLVGRDAEKGERARWELRNSAVGANVQFLRADLSLVREANRLADEVSGRWPALHRLVHCAGVVHGRRELTSEGVESNFAINYLSRFVLSERLLPLLEKAGQPGHAARIVIVGGAAQNGTVHYDDVNLTKRFGILRVVGQFCQANDLFTVEFARRLAAGPERPAVTITSLKLGVVKTSIRRDFPLWMKWLVPLVFDPLLGQTAEEAAASALRLLLDEEFEGVTGALFLKIKKFKPIVLSERLIDPEEGRRLWALSKHLMANGMDSQAFCRHLTLKPQNEPE
jgi:NAD(P)-dependent dehydrogenase (short-subunit alcohol dehydrogenase family)